jgi:LysR family glycine cleavage system transcriptional activator
MPPPLRTLSGLIDFAAAARHGSFRLAAQELHKTPAAVGQQIKQLEESLGFALFTRFPRHVALTEKGEELSHTVGHLLDELRGKITALQAEDEETVLKVTTTHSFAVKWLVPHLHRFTRRHPDLDVRVLPNDAVVSVEDGSVDVALRIGPHNGPQEAFYREKLIVVCAPCLDADASADWRDQPPRLADLLRYPLLHIEDPRWWRDVLAQEGLSSAKPRFGRSYTHGGILAQAAVAGLGVALVAYPLVVEDLARGNLIAVDCAPVDSGVSYRLLQGHNRGGTRKIELFRAWIYEEMAALEQDLRAGPSRTS